MDDLQKILNIFYDDMEFKVQDREEMLECPRMQINFIN